MKRYKTQSMLLAIFAVFLCCFASTVRATTMPQYERLQPITANLSVPTAVAVDDDENIYVTEANNNKLLVYNQNGIYLKTLSGFDKPISVAVDANGKILVGNDDKGNVEVYDAELTLRYKLGSGDGEFTQPGAIAIDISGNIYVADSEEDKIKVYNPDGFYNFSFGTSGSADGQFNFPTSIAVNNIAGEIIVSDLQIIQSPTGSHQGARIQVFDVNGGFKRSLGTFGQGDGLLTMPLGVQVDGEGRIYVTDAYQNVIQVFDSDGTFLGTLYDPNNPMRTPLGIAIGDDTNRLFIASLNTSTVEVYGSGGGGGGLASNNDPIIWPPIADIMLNSGQSVQVNLSDSEMDMEDFGGPSLRWSVIAPRNAPFTANIVINGSGDDILAVTADPKRSGEGIVRLVLTDSENGFTEQRVRILVSASIVKIANLLDGSQIDPDDIPTIRLDVSFADRLRVQFSKTADFAKGKETVVIRARKGASARPSKRAWRKIIATARRNNNMIYLRGLGRNTQNKKPVTGAHILLRMTSPLLAYLAPNDGAEILENQPPTFAWTANGMERLSILLLSASGKKVFQAKLKDDDTTFTPTLAKWNKIVQKIRKAGPQRGIWCLSAREIGTRTIVESERRLFTVLPLQE